MGLWDGEPLRCSSRVKKKKKRGREGRAWGIKLICGVLVVLLILLSLEDIILLEVWSIALYRHSFISPLSFFHLPNPSPESFEREVNIQKNNINTSAISQPLALDLVRKLLSQNPQERPSAEAALFHPLFWNEEKQLNFLRDASDRMEIEGSDSFIIRALERHVCFSLSFSLSLSLFLSFPSFSLSLFLSFLSPSPLSPLLLTPSLGRKSCRKRLEPSTSPSFSGKSWKISEI